MLLEIKGLHAAYGAHEVLHGIDLHLDAGEIVCILGNNAAGKSTLIKTILGLVHVTAGTITLRGERIDGLKPQRIISRGLAVVPEDGQVFAELTVLENLRMGLYLRHRDVRLDDALERVFALYPVLRDRRAQKAGLMSGGERQMLAMARALISDPQVLILDSPSMGLAPRLVHRQFALLRELNEGGMTVLVIEQNANMALALSHRGYVLQQGAVVMQGNAKELLRNEQMKLAYLT